jgi:hypothetical protein
MRAHIITRLALDSFSREELVQIGLAARALTPGDSGIVILPGKPELYRLTRTREGVALDLATEEEAARVLAGPPRPCLPRPPGNGERAMDAM